MLLLVLTIGLCLNMLSLLDCLMFLSSVGLGFMTGRGLLLVAMVLTPILTGVLPGIFLVLDEEDIWGWTWGCGWL